MASYPLTTTVDQEAVLSWIVKRYNLEHDTKITNGDYVALRLPQLLAPFQEGYQEALSTALVTKFRTADPQVQGQVITLLGALP